MSFSGSLRWVSFLTLILSVKICVPLNEILPATNSSELPRASWANNFDNDALGNSLELPRASLSKLFADSVPTLIVPFTSSITIELSYAANTCEAFTHAPSHNVYKALLVVLKAISPSSAPALKAEWSEAVPKNLLPVTIPPDVDASPTNKRLLSVV